VTQRSWLITGVNSGFGRHTTEQLLAHGYVATLERSFLHYWYPSVR
jgi:NAD(P)-dependent dehydrogenase (short-subunit alcohol dehydrogenase family)